MDLTGRALVYGTPRRESFPQEARKHAWQGAREGSWLAYTHHIPVPTLDLHAVDRYLNIGSILGLDQEPADFSFPIPQSASSRIDSLLRQYDTDRAHLAIIAPGTIWETKHWGSDKFAKVASHFMVKGFAVVLTGSQRERAVCEEVAALAPGTVDLAGMTTLSELTALIRRSAICITNNSGPMHLAVALDRPVISIFGPTDPVWIGPYKRADAVLHAELECSPCYLRKLKDCHHDHACMNGVSASAVIERAERILIRKPEATRPGASLVIAVAC